MRLLLDTSVLIWTLVDSPQLGPDASSEIHDPHNEIFVSVVSVWEIAIKRGLGKLNTPPDVGNWLPEMMEAMHLLLIPIQFRHAAAVEHLPYHHRDPFDRLLIAQAIEEGLVVATRDARYQAYPIRLIPC